MLLLSISVNPIYYVFFTTSTIIASAILFQGFNTTDAGKTVSLICGFLIIFMGVYLLNLSREPESPKGHSALQTGMMSEFSQVGLPRDKITSADSRYALQTRECQCRADCRQTSTPLSGQAVAEASRAIRRTEHFLRVMDDDRHCTDNRTTRSTRPLARRT